MSYYSQILTKEMLQEHFVNQSKSSRQIAREFHISRKIVNKSLIDYGFTSIKDYEENDLP